jgi:hypothetical protein
MLMHRLEAKKELLMTVTPRHFMEILGNRQLEEFLSSLHLVNRALQIRLIIGMKRLSMVIRVSPQQLRKEAWQLGTTSHLLILPTLYITRMKRHFMGILGSQQELRRGVWVETMDSSQHMVSQTLAM